MRLHQIINSKMLIFAVLCIPVLYAESMPLGQILNEADQRIEQYRTSDVTLTLLDKEGTPIPKGTRVRVQQVRHQFLFGCNFFMFDRCGSQSLNELYEKRFSELFNFATLGFYWSSYEPQADKTLYHERLKAAQWCKEHHITAKGHPLVWTLEPQWLKQRSTIDAQNRLWFRIRREVSDFEGLIDTWDVLNEPCVGIRQGKARDADTIVDLYEQMKTTPLIRKAFLTAEAANPDATLILNDFNTDKVYEKVLQDCLTKGNPVRIDAIGIQSHMHHEIWKPDKIWDVCERFSTFNKPLHFTEVTILSGSGKQDDWGPTTPFLEERQAEEVVQFYTILFSHPAVEAITWWDFSDRGAWQKAPAGLVREDMTPKPAYAQLKTLIKEKWWTDRTITVQTRGRIHFNGFLGDYRISTEGEPSISASYTLTKDVASSKLNLE